MSTVTVSVDTEKVSVPYGVVIPPSSPLSLEARRLLVPGTYRPGPTTTGPIPGVPLRKVEGDLAATADNQIIENVDVNGRINVKTFKNVKIRNFISRGTIARGQDTAFIIGTGDNLNGAIIEDGLLIGPGNPWCSAMRGGNYAMRRVEVTNASDGICLTSAIGSVTVEGCWIHNGYYLEWDQATGATSQGGNNYNPYAGGFYTHADGVQFHRGKNYVIRGNMIGGARVPGWGKHHTGAALANAAGDDMFNAALMVKQEVDSTLANRIENVVIESNWLAGGSSTINHPAGNGNTFASTVIRNNRFIRSTWGEQLYILTPLDSYGKPTVGVYSGNVFDDDGSPVPFSRG